MMNVPQVSAQAAQATQAVRREHGSMSEDDESTARGTPILTPIGSPAKKFSYNDSMQSSQPSLISFFTQSQYKY